MDDAVTLIKKALQLRKELPVATITDETLAKKLVENKGNLELTKKQLNNLIDHLIKKKEVYKGILINKQTKRNKGNFKAVGKFARQMSTLKKMFGDTVSDEALLDTMEKYEGDVELVVDELVWASEAIDAVADEENKEDVDFSAEVFVNDPIDSND
ncbi:hypothetical protein RFI_36645 [Reticulomyxa filosa]|uniref:Uncharacterized protein n=1 Tax=Reticulomyxa filosa TaxID=46433 RepID=X6LJA2_RETFI|nr:hypothetical protein RFI_36645 [Reticulomyxa filosa]|eukprot:ETO00795.1 hypothetical protein RFI_36645 [Reticulomyxa filosa]